MTQTVAARGDIALNFVRQDDLIEDELRGLVGAQGSVIIAEKYREAVHGDERCSLKLQRRRCKRGTHSRSASTTSHGCVDPGRSARRKLARENNSRSRPAFVFTLRHSPSSSSGVSWWTGWPLRSRQLTTTTNCWGKPAVPK